ncbi:hypothetical protein AXE65_01425 [Ventosimonas gracilis]|uniref:Cell division protein FtsQ n=1 Tax=Ventosimonas gracilis TaxID=1680762 RepID=A0A139SV15_9GAMM|nr:FtsQ-type POTRA domain-containing protein [Ventosimonas gracilis]KXU38403.1 hypothetical protein AXE65_01425 [Ventosimonas gracilis]
MFATYLRADPIYSPDLLRGASRVREQPSRRANAQGLVRGLALALALLLAGGCAALRLLMVLCQQAGRAAPTLLLGALLLGGFQLVQSLFTDLDQPLAQVQLVTSTANIDQQQVQQRLAPLFARSGFFSLDLDAARRELESLPLIAHASLRRRWPGQLVVQLQMHQPLARWGEQGLLASGGQVLAEGAQHYPQLPQLIGPIGSEEALFKQYQQFEQMLRPLGLSVVRLVQQERGSGFLTAKALSGDRVVELALGSGQWMEKMQRFIHFVRQGALSLSELARVDLRHRNGFAVVSRQAEPKAAP